ncbi:CHASE2 domain-containing protein [Phenylobacterium sp.]|uniref:CHASE2 domain-containing protein n=1 Tax=Phenylobacterium sp. TaxID=1871053 RepID=UPI002E35534E|nr:CHASE2 domain-containing protein [Phenylobacterium sp.]HEX2560200.1 CHASE2 domain-containing protein [Phenylobacterium sp.]
MISAKSVLKAIAVSFVLAGSAYAVSKIDLFGLESNSDRLADHVYQRVTAAEYGKARKGQQAVSVIYVDETSVETLKGFGWNRFPPTFDQQWLMLDDILNVGGAPPAAMFMDFVYLGQGGVAEGFDGFLQGIAGATRADVWADKPGCRTDPLIKIACIVEAGGVPMIFAKPSPADLEMFTEAQAAMDRVAVLAPALVAEDAYPLITSYDFDRAKAERLGVARFDISPALAMYAAWCVRRADGCGIAEFQELKRRAKAALAGGEAASPTFAKVFDAPLDVVWGSRPDPAFLTMTQAVSGHPAPCRTGAATWGDRLAEQMAGLRGPGEGARQECPYTLSLGYDRLVAGHGLEPQDLERLLAGRLVMVGGHFRASSDWVESPVHGQVPGVQFHAMALDNMIEQGANYRRNGEALLDSDLLESLLVAALAFCGVLGVMTRNNLLDKAKATGMEPRLRSAVYGPLYIVLFATSIGVVSFATWLGVTVANRSPINWIGITGVAMGFLFYATRQTLPADICGSLERSALARRLLAWGRLCFDSLKFEEDRLLPVRPPQTPPSIPIPETKAVPESPAHAQS